MKLSIVLLFVWAVVATVMLLDEQSRARAAGWVLARCETALNAHGRTVRP